MKATEVTAGLAESNGSLLPGPWRDSLHVTCGLTACTPGSAPGPTLGNEYGKNFTLPFTDTQAQASHLGYPKPVLGCHFPVTRKQNYRAKIAKNSQNLTGLCRKYGTGSLGSLQ